MSSKRNYGIDLLRLISMFFVVMLHLLGHGGVLKNASGTQYVPSWLLEVIAYCAVNCYAIISGYVCYREEETEYHYGNYLSFWIPVFVYSFGITLGMYIFFPNKVSIDMLIQSALPVSSAEYWYVNAYTGLFFVIPWINKLIRKITNQELNQLVLMLFVVFSLYSTFSSTRSDVFKLMGGYSFVWLSIMYIFGAWIKKNKINEKKSTFWWLSLTVICILITWLYKISDFKNNSMFVSYVSFTIVIIAVSLVVIFSRLKLNSASVFVIRIFSPAAFGVYLIHHQSLVFKHFIVGAFSWIASSKAWLLPLNVLACVSVIFIVCIVIELVRQAVFKLLKLDLLIKKAQNQCNLFITKCIHRVCG